jgi:hypothetical protein
MFALIPVFVVTNIGYFGGTMPVISVKPCHFKRSYNDIKKLLLFLFEYALSKRITLQINSM